MEKIVVSYTKEVVSAVKILQFEYKPRYLVDFSFCFLHDANSHICFLKPVYCYQLIQFFLLLLDCTVPDKCLPTFSPLLLRALKLKKRGWLKEKHCTVLFPTRFDALIQIVVFCTDWNIGTIIVLRKQYLRNIKSLCMNKNVF